MTQLNALQVAETAWYGGFWGSDLIMAVAVARGESDWRTDARLTTSQEDRTGLWQINTYAHPQYKKQSLLDPDYNAQPAFDVFHGPGYRGTPGSVRYGDLAGHEATRRRTADRRGTGHRQEHHRDDRTRWRNRDPVHPGRGIHTRLRSRQGRRVRGQPLGGERTVRGGVDQRGRH